MLIRHAETSDASGCLEVYGPFADDTATSFEERAPSLGEFERRIARIARTHAFLVAEDRGRIAGFAYAGVHRERPAYRWSSEVSVYVGPDYRGQGLGRALYEPLFALLEEQGYRMLLAGVTLPNPASVALHASLGFEEVGVIPAHRLEGRGLARCDVDGKAVGRRHLRGGGAALTGSAGQAGRGARALSRPSLGLPAPLEH